MLLSETFDAFLIRALGALEPYLDEIVCGGGVANALYRHHDAASEVRWGYLGTKDFDAVVPQTIPVGDRPPLAECMEQAGFVEKRFGASDLPVIKYVPSDAPMDADLEFLCPLAGLKGARSKTAPAHVVQKGVHAQPLRYLEIPLKSHPWTVPLSRVPGFERISHLTVNVPNPAAYVFQKILIREQGRDPASMNKDCFYIYEVSVVFRDALDKIRMEYDRLDPCHPTWKKRFARNIRHVFYSEESEGPIAAARVAEDSGSTLNLADTSITAEMVCRAVSNMITALLD